jgi:L-alanine-DL-glutamate epimerase-like enolase superfamily enzyme
MADPVTDPLPRLIDAVEERWPLATPFVIARGAKTEARVIVVRVGDGRHEGRGEAVPYARYGETVEGALAALTGLDAPLDRDRVQQLLPAGAARNALDCALWDYEAKRSGAPAWQLAGVSPPKPLLTAYTLSVGEPQAMAAAAKAVPHLPLLKIKLAGQGDAERLAAIRSARPDARLIADANEAWTPELLGPLMAAAAKAGVELIEQPLPAGADEALSRCERIVPVCADESAHTASNFPQLADRYDAINIKLDKTGGLTGALSLAREARTRGFRIMVGSMVATSLAVAPALLIAGEADWVDLDGPLLLARDRAPGLVIRDGLIEPASPGLWG